MQFEITQIEKKIKLGDDHKINLQENNFGMYQQFQTQNGFYFPATVRNDNHFMNNLYYDAVQIQMPVQTQAPIPFIPAPRQMNAPAPIQNKRKRIEICPKHRVQVVEVKVTKKNFIFIHKNSLYN